MSTNNGPAIKPIVLTPQGEKKAWTPDIVIRRLLARYRAGLPMRSKDIDIDDKNLRLTTIRLFGSWTAGLESAGLFRLPTGEILSLIDILRRRAENGQAITITALRKDGKYGRKLYREAVAKFGGWKAALAQSGVYMDSVQLSGMAKPTPMPIEQNRRLTQ